jgi:homoserine acetyltransferase
VRHGWPDTGLQRALEALLLASLFACGGTQQLARLGDFTTQSGEVISDCRLGFRTFGRLDPGRSNAVLVPGWFLGTSQGLARQIGPGGVVDSDRFFVVAVDPLGNGVSSSPSQGLQRFPPLTIEDQAQAQFLLVTRILGLEPTRTRFIWSQITGTSARWEQAYSLDAGKAWQTNWIMEFKRA